MSTQKIYGLIADCGDGSSVMCWFRELDDVNYLLDEDNGHEQFWPNEGGTAEELTFPADLDLVKCGFRFDTAEDYKD